MYETGSEPIADTVDTIPPETLEAYRDHGDPRVRIHDDPSATQYAFQRLAELRIDEERISRELEEEGARKFSDSYLTVLEAIEEKEDAIHRAR